MASAGQPAECQAQPKIYIGQIVFDLASKTGFFQKEEISYGEFDSGSERTLAAWIRHASRTRLSRLAITGKVEWRMGA